MKILRISLRNIASLAGEHTVDFTCAPLLHAGLFSISGPTGSGKSTLLDALCLALFDETPRMAVAVGTQAVAEAGVEVQQDDVRNLLRRGCGTGFAEVAFLGVDGEIYTARWEVRRARETATGRLQKTQHTLLRGNVLPGREGVVAAGGTATEVKREIVARLGLSFDQFRRAVLLAQGDFATFLKARDTERAEILQALTGTERFENISKAVFYRHKQEQELVQGLRNQIGAAHPLPPEARADAEEALRKAVDLQKQVERELAARLRQLEWFKVDAGNRQKLDEASREVSVLDALVQANGPRERALGWIRKASIEAGPLRLAERRAQASLEEATEREALLRQGDPVLAEALAAAQSGHRLAQQALEEALMRQRATEAELAKARVLDGELDQMEQSVGLAQREHVSAREVVTKAEQALASLRAELRRLGEKKQLLQQRIAQVALFAPFAGDLEAWLERFKFEERARLKKDLLEQRLRDAGLKAGKTADDLKRFSTFLPDLGAKRTQAEEGWKKAADKAATFHPEKIQADRRNATELQAVLHKSQTHLAEQERLREERRKCVEGLEALAEQIAKESLRSVELSEKSIPAALSSVNQARESVRLAEAAASKHAAALRDALVPGEACPVCGSTEHPRAGVEVSAQNAVLNALRRDSSEKERMLNTLQGELAAAEARIAEKKEQQHNLTRECGRLEKQLREADAYIPGLVEVAELFRKPAAQRDIGLKGLADRTSDLLRTLEEKDAERNVAERREKTLRAEFDKAEQELRAAERAEEAARTAGVAAQAEHDSALAAVEAIRAEHAALLETLSPVTSMVDRDGIEGQSRDVSGPENSYTKAPKAFRDWFTTGVREYNEAVRLLEGAAQEEAVKLSQRETFEGAVVAAQEALGSRSETLELVVRNLQEKRAARAALLGGRTVEAAESEMAAEVQSARAREGETSGASVEAQNKLGAHRGLLLDQQARVSSLQGAALAESAAMDAWINGFVAREGRVLDRMQLDEWLGRDAHWIAREQGVLEEAVKKLAAARGLEAGMRRQLDEHLAEKSVEADQATVQADAERLGSEATAAAEAADLRRAVVLSDDERIRNTGELSGRLAEQERQAAPWMQLNELIGSSDGTRFRNTAQQWTLEILLKHANAQLAMLSGRYRLERLRGSLNLLVTDLEMDGQQRSVHSLSGGESFLVSLGLALGLASLTSSRLLIESLFIDEGFGSLDSETLRVALNALNHLESQGRKVGVISHVSEMVDAIPVQVRVVRGPGGASKIVI